MDRCPVCGVVEDCCGNCRCNDGYNDVKPAPHNLGVVGAGCESTVQMLPTVGGTVRDARLRV